MVCKPLAYLERSTCVQRFCHPGHNRGQNGETAFTLVSPRREGPGGGHPPGTDVFGQPRVHDDGHRRR